MKRREVTNDAEKRKGIADEMCDFRVPSTHLLIA